ncbi:MAG: sulfide/dihydroorotate dehydrogenase-like FAD/NAD-binding protein [Bacteroidales bacterium]|nr:sulfide/dihydroorotate dehydrogenase-like FAD/NAD-binding protein [Bacteroidales bacterium]
MYEILEKEQLTPDICRMKVKAPRLAKVALPGQFLIVRATENGERIPLTIADYDSEEGTVVIATQSIGTSTNKINALEVGESFIDVAGPLGKPSEFCNIDIPKDAYYCFIAGGLGAAPIYPQAKYLHEKGIHCDVILGARSSVNLVYKKELEQVCDKVYVCTDDGSEGFHGLVTAQLEKAVKEDGKKYTQAVAIGPMIMMKFATLTASSLNIPVIVSLNTLMVDGTGMCGACRITVDGVTRFACVEGPEFDGTKVDFAEALSRGRIYSDLEKASLEEYHKCKIGRGK